MEYIYRFSNNQHNIMHVCNLLGLFSCNCLTIPFCLAGGGILAGIQISEKNPIALIMSLVLIITPYIFPSLLFLVSGTLGISTSAIN